MEGNDVMSNDAITLVSPRIDENGFFSVWGGAHPVGGDVYLVKTQAGRQTGTCALEDDFCFMDDGDEITIQ